MSEINVEQDLATVNDQIGKLAEELNRLNAARDNLIQQLQNLSGVAMYLRGKQPESEPIKDTAQDESEETFTRTLEYPDDKVPTKK